LIAQRVLVKKRKGIFRRRKIEKACAIEAILTFYILNPCGKAIPQTVFKKSAGTDTYNMLFDQKVAEEMAKNKRGSSLQQILFEQLNNNRR